MIFFSNNFCFTRCKILPQSDSGSLQDGSHGATKSPLISRTPFRSQTIAMVGMNTAEWHAAATFFHAANCSAHRHDHSLAPFFLVSLSVNVFSSCPFMGDQGRCAMWIATSWSAQRVFVWAWPSDADDQVEAGDDAEDRQRWGVGLPKLTYSTRDDVERKPL